MTGHEQKPLPCVRFTNRNPQTTTPHSTVTSTCAPHDCMSLCHTHKSKSFLQFVALEINGVINTSQNIVVIRAFVCVFVCVRGAISGLIRAHGRLFQFNLISPRMRFFRFLPIFRHFVVRKRTSEKRKSGEKCLGGAYGSS